MPPRLGVVSASVKSPVGFCSEQPAAAGISKEAGVAGTHRLSVCYIELLLFTFCCRVEEEFVHLLLVDVRRRIDHHVATLVVLRECDVVTDCLLPTEERAYAVKSECKTTVRRSTELESIDDEAELVFSILLADSENLEHTLLHCSLVDTDRTATELCSVEDEVIGICTAYRFLCC